MERIDNGTRSDFVYLGQKAIARITNNKPSYIFGDYQNSPLFESNSAGSVTRAPNFVGYGHPDSTGVSEIPGYSGAAPDAETGLLYLGARYLYAERFLSPDPAALDPTSPVGLNRYAYANDNPVRFTDPDGRQSVGETIDSAAAGCGTVTCGFYAVAHAAWSMTGAEPLSQVADKGWSSVSTGDKIGAVAAVAAVVPVGRIAGKLAEGAVGAEAAASAAKGTHTVYQGIDKAGDVRYVGITSRNVATRGAEHVAAGGGKEGLVYQAVEGAQGLTKQQARVMEQTLINQHGLEKNGGQLLNKINSISPKYWKENGIMP